MATAVALVTAEEVGRRPDPGHPEELVQGRVIKMMPPDRVHGYVWGQTYFLLRLFVEGRDLGRVLSNDSGVITERDLDTVRGVDVAYYSYERLPRGPLAKGYDPKFPNSSSRSSRPMTAGVMSLRKSWIISMPESWSWSLSTPNRDPLTSTAVKMCRGNWGPTRN